MIYEDIDIKVTSRPAEKNFGPGCKKICGSLVLKDCYSSRKVYILYKLLICLRKQTL